MTTGALILVIGFLVLAIGSGARLAIGLTLRPMAFELGIGRGMLGYTVAVYFVVTALAMLWAGRLVDTHNPRIVLGAGLIVSAIGIGLIGAVAAPWHLVVLYGIVFGAGSGIASITPVNIMVTRHFTSRPGLANGISSAGMCAGQLFMIAALTFVLFWVGWRSVYLWLGLAHLAVLPLLLLTPRDAASGAAGAQGSPPPGMTLGQAMRTGRFWLFTAIYAQCGLDDFFVSTHVVAFAEDKGISTMLAGNLLALMGLTALFGVVLAGWWCDRSGPLVPTLACFLLRIASFLLIMVDQSTVSVTVFTLVFGITYMMTAPLTVLFIKESFGLRNLGTITGVVIMVHHMAGGLGAWLGGVVFDVHGNYDVAFAVMLASSLLAAALTFVLGKGRWLSR